MNGIRNKIPTDGDLIVRDGRFARAARNTSANYGVFHTNYGVFHNDLVALNSTRAADRTSTDDFACYRATREDNPIVLDAALVFRMTTVKVRHHAARHTELVVNGICPCGCLAAVCRKRPLICSVRQKCTSCVCNFQLVVTDVLLLPDGIAAVDSTVHSSGTVIGRIGVLEAMEGSLDLAPRCRALGSKKMILCHIRVHRHLILVVFADPRRLSRRVRNVEV